MNTNKGLVLDGFSIDTEDKKYNDAMNVMLTPDKLSIQNEPGFTLQTRIDGVLIGVIETPDSIIEFYTRLNPITNTTTLLIYMNNTLLCCSLYIYGDINNPISGTYMYNYKKELIITWCSGTNSNSDEMRYLNCTSLQVTLGDYKDISEAEAYKTLLNGHLPTVEVQTGNFTNGGNLKAGTYFVAISYNVTKNDRTSYSHLSNPIYLINHVSSNNKGYEPNAYSNNSIKVQIQNIYKIYDSVNIAIIYFNGTVSEVRVLENIKINYNQQYVVNKIISVIDTLPIISLNDVLIKMNPYIKAGILTTIKNKLIAGNVNVNDTYNNKLQLAANNIYFECVPIAYTNNMNLNELREYGDIHKTFQEDEVYALYAGYRHVKGGYIGIYHIPGPIASNYKTTKLHPLESKNATEVYDSDFPEFGNTPVRHHKMPTYKDIINRLNSTGEEVTSNTIGLLQNPYNMNVNMYVINMNLYSSLNGLHNTYLTEPNGNIGLTKGSRVILPSYVNAKVVLDGTITVHIPVNLNKSLTIVITLYNNTNLTNTLEGEYTTENLENLTYYEDPLEINTSDVVNIGNGELYTFPISYSKNITKSVIIVVGLMYPRMFPDIISYTGFIKSSNFKVGPEIIKEFTLDLAVKNVIIPPELSKICNGVDIFCAKRTMHNSRVIDQDVLHTKFWNHCRVYGQVPSNPVDDLYNEYKDNRYYKGHAYSLLHQHPDISSIKQMDVFAIDTTYGANATGFQNYGYNIIRPITIMQPVAQGIDGLSYIKNNNIIDNNIRGESAIKTNTPPPKSVLPIEYSTGETNSYTQRVFFFVNYISSNIDFYNNYRSQAIIKLGSTMETNFIIKGDIFYCPQYGIRVSRLATDKSVIPANDTDETNIFRTMFIYPIKSQYNLSSRYNGSLPTQRIYPHASIEVLTNIPTINDNYIKRDTDDGFNIAYNKRCDYYTYINSHIDDINIKTSNVIAISDIASSESKYFNWKLFNTTSYISLPSNKGALINILSNGNTLYIQTLFSLFLASIKDVLNLADNQKAYLGNADIFDRDPEEVLADKDGYIGCQHRYATTINEDGYFVVDAMKGKIFKIGQDQIAISDLNASNFFKKELSITTIDNPYLKTEGIELVSDRINNRVIYRNNKTNNTLSFSPKGTIWVSKHKYDAFKSASNRKGLYNYTDVKTIIPALNEITCIKTKQLSEGSYGKYGRYSIVASDQNIEPSYVDIVFNPMTATNELLQSVVWKTNILKNGITSYEDTIEFIMAYNKTQCSGLIDIIRSNAYYFKDSAILKNDTWFFNNLEDNVINDKQAILNESNMPTSNVNALRKAWYQKSQFMSDMHVVRFGLSKNVKGLKVVLDMVDLLTIKDAR